MLRLLTGYAVTFNLRHNRSGHLFQNRYKSIVCDDEAYLLELVRYIHLNPLRAGVVADLEGLTGYGWCGHRQLLGRRGPELIAEKEVLPLFARSKRMAVHRYLEFLAHGVNAGPSAKLSCGGRRISRAYNSSLKDDDLYDERILGGGDFVARVLGAGGDQGRSLSLGRIIAIVAGHYKLAQTDLAMPSKRPIIVRVKALICFVATRLCRLKGTEVGKPLAYSTTAVSRAALRGKTLYEEDTALQALLNGEM